jgi:hypothetical protein
MNSDIQRISDALYLCSPFLCFDIERADLGYRVIHYTPFSQKSLLHSMLGKDFKIEHVQSYGSFPLVSSRDVSVPDGTLKGLLFALKELIKANMFDESQDFDIFLDESGVVSSDLVLVQDMFNMSLLPSSLKGLYSLLSYNLPVHQAFQVVSNDYAEFVEPDFYKIQIMTDIGMFERKELFGSYGIKIQSIQGYILTCSGLN